MVAALGCGGEIAYTTHPPPPPTKTKQLHSSLPVVFQQKYLPDLSGEIQKAGEGGTPPSMCHMLYATDPEDNLLPQLVYEAVFYLIFFFTFLTTSTSTTTKGTKLSVAVNCEELPPFNGNRYAVKTANKTEAIGPFGSLFKPRVAGKK